jgi:predicted transposase/invertase (TIGR01784 family)
MKKSGETGQTSTDSVEENSKLPNPHDKFFKEVWSRSEVAWDFLSHYLPAAVVDRFTPSAVSLSKDSFIDERFREHFSDLLYRVELREGGSAYVYVLLEHKSYPDKWVCLQLLRYLLRIWELQIKQDATQLTPVIPLVLYHGRRQWKVKQNLASLFTNLAGFEAYLPDFRYELCDVTQQEDQAIQGQIMLRIALLLFKYIFRPELHDRLPTIFGLLRELGAKQTGLEYLQVLLRYLAAGAENLSEDMLRQAVDAALNTPEGQTMATLAEVWMQQGFEKGAEQARVMAVRQSILDVLEARFGAVPNELTQVLLRVSDAERFKALLREAARASTLTDFQRRLGS